MTVPSRRPLREFQRRFEWALPALAALAFGVVRLPELTRSSFWYDELFSVGVAGLPAGDALRRVIADHTNPPLFYALLKAWMAVGGEGDQWVRLLPCLAAMLVGAGLVWLAREVHAGAVAGTLGVALAAASPLTVDLANEVRGYSLLALFACLSLAATLYDRRLRTRESFALLALINIALVYTHYFGWLTVGAELIVAFVWWTRADAARLARGAALTAAVFAPWAIAVIAHATSNPAPLRNVGWIIAPALTAPLSLLSDFTGRSGNAMADNAWLAFIGVALVALAVTRWRARAGPAATAGASGAGSSADRTAVQDSGADNSALVLLATAGLLVPAAVWAISVASGHSVWVPRYLIGAAAPTALLVAIAVTSLPPRRSATMAIVGLVWAVVALGALPRRAPGKFDWRRFARRIEVAVGSPRDVYALEAYTAAPFERYAGAGTRVHVIHALAELPQGDAWLVYRPESFTAGSPTEAVKQLGHTIVVAISAETAGQRIVAIRLR